MSKLLKSKILLGALVAVVFALGLAVSATPASADCTISATLRVGSKGADVMCLQTLVGAKADGSFGPMTKASVMAYQSSHALVADGVVGPKTIAVLMAGGAMSGNFPAGCTSASGFSPTTGVPCTSGPSTGLMAGCTSSTTGFSVTTGKPCNGGSTGGTTVVVNSTAAGNISSDSILGGFNNTVVGAGDINHEVVGLQLNGSGGGSNLNLNSMTVQFLETNNASSRFADYFSSVSVWENGLQVGSVPATAFNSNSNSGISNYVYSASVPLSGATVTAGQSSNFYVAVTANQSLDSGNFAANAWAVLVNNIRFTDGTGATLVYNPSSFVALQNATTLTGNSAAPNTAYFSFGSSATANNIIFNIARGSSDQNSHVVIVNATGGTISKVPLLAIDLSAQGGQTVSVNKIPVTFTPNSGSQVFKQLSEVYLMSGPTVLDSEAVPSSGNCATNSTACTITFKVNPASPLLVGSTKMTITVAADVNSVTGGGYTAGDNVTVSTPASTASNFDLSLNTPTGTELVTSSNYSSVIPGTANGQAVAFFATGLNVNVASNTCSAQQAGFANSPSVLTCTVNFSVTAEGAPMYIPQASGTVAAHSNTVNFLAQNNGSTVVSGTPSTLTVSATYTQNGTNATASQSNTEWTIPSGATANFTGTVIVDDTTSVSSGLYRAFLNDVKYGTVSGTWGNDYTFNLGTINPVVPGYTQLN